MRGRILMPIIALLLVFCGVLGFAVYTNIATATTNLLDKQLDDTLGMVEARVLESRNAGELHDGSYQGIIAGIGVADGGIFVVNASGQVIADSHQVMIDLNVADQPWYNEARSNLLGSFTAVYGQADVYAHSVILDDKLVVSYISNHAVTELFTTPIYVIGVVGIISVTIVCILIYFLVTRQLINPIEALEDQVEGLASGEQIDTKLLKGNPSLVATAKELNELKIVGVRKEPPVAQTASKEAAKTVADEKTHVEDTPPEEVITVQPLDSKLEAVQAEQKAQAEAEAEAARAAQEAEAARAAQEAEAARAAAEAERVAAEEKAAQEAEAARVAQEAAAAEAVAAQVPVAAQPIQESSAAPLAQVTPAAVPVAQESSAAPETPVAQEASAAQAPQEGALGSFEFVEVLREAFEANKALMTAKSIKFSLLVDNATPKMIIANRDEMLVSLYTALSGALIEADQGSKVDARVTCVVVEETQAAHDVAIIFTVEYNGREAQTLLEAKRG